MPRRSALLLVLVLSLLLPGSASAEWTIDQALGADWLSIEFEHRVRYEGLSDPFRTLNAGDQYSDVVALRTRLHARAKLPKGLTLGAELIDSRTFQHSDALLNSTLVNPAELLQAYLQHDGDVAGGKLRSRLGRITMDIGSRRFVSRNRYRNTINGFTGIDLDWHGGADRQNRNLRAFFTLPVQREPNPQSAGPRRQRLRQADVVFDTESFDVLCWGLFAAQDFDELLMLPDVRGELFLFGLFESDDADRPTRNRNFYTVGSRIFRKPAKETFDFTLEGAFQVGQSRSGTGSTRELDHLAGFFHGTLAYTFDALWTPRLVFQFDYASGDSSPTDGNNERFDTLFGARRFEFGPTSLFGPFARGNLVTPGVRVHLKPASNVTAFAAVRTYWLASETDALTGAGIVDPVSDSGDHAGTTLEFRVRWNLVPKNVRLEAGYIHLFADEIFDTNSGTSNSNRQGDSDYFYAQAKLNF